MNDQLRRPNTHYPPVEVDSVPATDAFSDAKGLPASTELQSLPPARVFADGVDAAIDTVIRNHGRYRLIRLLGQGGMGRVYLAEHMLMQRQVAMKVLPPQAHSPALRERFLRELRALAKLDHPNIVRIYDAEECDGLLFFAMEWVEGQTLAHLVEASGPQNTETACRLIHQVASGLLFAHDNDMIHRDIKPNNLILRPAAPGRGETVKIIDFGLVRDDGDDTKYFFGTPGYHGIGTLGYMAPEQARDARTVDRQADVFSLGCTFFYMLSGHSPYATDRESMFRLLAGKDVIIPIQHVRPDLPDGLIEVVNRSVAHCVESRYQSCDEFVKAIEPWAVPR